MDKRRHSNHPLMACEYVFAALGRIPFGIPLDLPAETTYYHTKAGLSPACIKTISEQEAQAMWKEFKEFAMKGNVIDLAVGVIIGGAFSKIVTSLVNDLIMPWYRCLRAKWISPICSWPWMERCIKPWRKQERQAPRH